MSRRQTFTIGALAGLILWPATAFAILVAVNMGARARRAAYRDATEAQRRAWDEFEAAHPLVDPS